MPEAMPLQQQQQQLPLQAWEQLQHQQGHAQQPAGGGAAKVGTSLALCWAFHPWYFEKECLSACMKNLVPWEFLKGSHLFTICPESDR
jgi:hypothetical protein